MKLKHTPELYLFHKEIYILQNIYQTQDEYLGQWERQGYRSGMRIKENKCTRWERGLAQTNSESVLRTEEYD